jgi:ribose transport system permease protein
MADRLQQSEPPVSAAAAGGAGRPAPRSPAGDGTQRSTLAMVASALSPRRISLVYVFIVIVAVFGIWKPSEFLTTSNFDSILDTNAPVAMAAVGLVLTFSAFQFDLAIGAEMGFGLIFGAWLSVHGLGAAYVLLAVVGAGALSGIVSGVLATAFNVSSFIGTIGTSSILLALVTIVSGGDDIDPLGHGFESLTTGKLIGLQYTVFYMLAIALIVWFVLERTPLGRRIYATGDSPAASRLSGVLTSRYIIGAFVACGVIAMLSGALIASYSESGDPTVGSNYLVPTFTACFLGSTQFKPGRFNVWGTVFAVYVLATGVSGLQELTSVTWLPTMFNGVALLIAVGATFYPGSPAQLRGAKRLTDALRRLNSAVAETPQAPAP